jgi:hypothetical protein
MRAGFEYYRALSDDVKQNKEYYRALSDDVKQNKEYSRLYFLFVVLVAFSLITANVTSA